MLSKWSGLRGLVGRRRQGALAALEVVDCALREAESKRIDRAHLDARWRDRRDYVVTRR